MCDRPVAGIYITRGMQLNFNTQQLVAALLYYLTPAILLGDQGMKVLLKRYFREVDNY